MIKNYIKAARLRTLPLSVSGIIVGSALAFSEGKFDLILFVLALCTTIGFQILSNFANDYGDGVKGTDTIRIGELRMVASGAIRPHQMKMAMVITTLITFVAAMVLIFLAFGQENFTYIILFFLLGIASIVAAIKYTVGKSAYGYSGFGDIFVFVFFGLLSVVGGNFLFTQQLDYLIFLPAFSIGCLSTAVLNLNNMRDRSNDEKVDKITLVVKLGPQIAKYYHYGLIGASLFFSVLYVSIDLNHVYEFLFVIAYIPLFKHLYFVHKNKEDALLDSQLKIVALSTFLFSILFGLGQVL